MTKEEALNLLCLIEAVYPLIIIKSETVTRWISHCELLDYNGVLAKLHAHIQKTPYPPRLDEIAVFSDSESKFPNHMQTWIEESEFNAQFVAWQKEYFIRNQ
ncbi:hypothetical protein V7654_21930 [Bacillus sp. JJ1609]|uniref:hypothetical protein n=1 Tax=Bacillus sp. JJ1609 TaxID=3122977 RepID=UPI0030003411